MGIPEHSVVTLRIFGDDLVPAEVTSRLGCEPSNACAKGDTRFVSRTGNPYVEKTGRWNLSATDRKPEDIPAQIREILDKLTRNPDVWAHLKSKYSMDFFCGVFMGSGNDALEFPPELLGELSARGICLSLDVYDHCDD